MRTNATSGLFCVLCALILLSVGNRAHAKRGCSAYGHSCFGGHGKRSDPHVPFNTMQSNVAGNEKSEEYEASRLGDEFLLTGADQKFRGPEEITFHPVRRQGSERFDPYTLSLLVGQWIASHRRLNHPDLELNKK